MSLAEQWNAEIHDGLEKSSGGPAWLSDLRKKGAAAFTQSGLPHRKVEDWKYTSLKLLEARSHRLALNDQDLGSAVDISWPKPVFDDYSTVLQLRNGRLQPGFDTPADIDVLPLGQAVIDSRIEAWLREILASLPVDGASRAFSALNHSMLGDGIVIRVPANTDAGTLLLQWSFDNLPPAMMFNTRIVLVLEEGARLSLVDQFESANPLPHALNLVSQVRLGKGAALNHVRVQAESVDTVLLTRTECDVAAGGRYQASSFDWGAGWVRHDSQVRLLGDGANGVVNGAFVLSGDQHLDHHVFVDHVRGGSDSSQFFRSVLGGSSRGVFNGKARICKGADGSAIRQSNANLLLSPLAEIDTKPELEIYADEVEASHGATVGQLDEDAVFYLRSRGLDEEEARNMLTSAFSAVVIDQSAQYIPENLASEIKHRMSKALDLLGDSGKTE